MTTQTPVNKSGNVTWNEFTPLAGSVTTVATLTAATIYYTIQNKGTGDITVAFAGTIASAVSGFLLKPGSSLEFSNFIPLGDVSVRADLTGTPSFVQMIASV